jgi:hypothetical protein
MSAVARDSESVLVEGRPAYVIRASALVKAIRIYTNRRHMGVGACSAKGARRSHNV